MRTVNNLITKDLYYERLCDLIEDLFALMWTMQPEDPNAFENAQAKDLKHAWDSLKSPLKEAFSVREGLQLISQFIEKGDKDDG